jgi:hypothetical protein
VPWKVRHGRGTDFCRFTFDLIARAAGSCSVRATTLNYEIRNDPVESESVVKIMLGQIDEVRYGVGGVLFEEPDLHDAFGGVDFSNAHVIIFFVKMGKTRGSFSNNRNRKA